MAMEINSVYSSYASSYTNVANSKKQTDESKDVAKQTESSATSKTNQTSSTKSTSQTTEEYLNNLRQKYSNVNITVADFSNEKQLTSYMFSSSGYNNIAISSSIIEKMASDSETAAKYEKVIADVPNLGEEFKSECAALGTELLACGTVIDKNGNVSYWGIGKSMESVENPGTVYKEKVQKQLEEKRAEKKKQEKAEEKKAEKKETQEQQQELRLARADSKEELLEKIEKGKTEEISADKVQKMISEDGFKGARIDCSL